MFRCGHCIKFAPEFVEASELLKTVAPTVTLLEVGILYCVTECYVMLWCRAIVNDVSSHLMPEQFVLCSPDE